MTLSNHETALIVGAGPIGLACAISGKRRGIDPLVIDAGPIANSIVGYPIGMTFFTTPERLEIGGHPIVSAAAKTTREEALMYYRGVVRAEGIRIATFTKLLDATRTEEAISCVLETRLGTHTMTCDRLVLATGYFDHPNMLGVKGEDLPHVTHYFREAHRASGLDVVVIGGKNSAVETALLLFRAGARVTLVHRGPEFTESVKYWLRPDIQNRIKFGEIDAHLGAQVAKITPTHVLVRTAEGDEVKIPADRVYAMTGFHPDFALFERIGIEYDEVSGRPAIDPDTLETNVPGVHLAGSPTAGRRISEVFIENGRWDGEKIFGDVEGRRHAGELYSAVKRERGE
jgi:thioredoxin reductase (NADPH)